MFQGAGRGPGCARETPSWSRRRRALRAREGDAALIGREFAQRRGLETGDRFRFGGIDNVVAGVFRSSELVEEGVILAWRNQRAFDSVREAELVPGPKATAQEIRELARLASASFRTCSGHLQDGRG